MRYIIERTEDKDIYISEGKRITKARPSMRFSPFGKALAKAEYKIVYSNDGLFYGGKTSTLQCKNIKLTKHYNSFEKFVEDHIELFL